MTPVTTADDYVIQLALDRGLLEPAALAAARARLEQEHSGIAVAPFVLIERLATEGWLDGRKLVDLLASEFGLSVADLSDAAVTSDALAELPRAQAERFQVLPLVKSGHTLRVAMADPLDVETIDGLHRMLGLEIDPSVATPDDIRRGIEHHYSRDEHAIIRLLDEFSDSGDVAGAPDVGEVAGGADAPINSLVNSIFAEAVQRRASDIHVEPLAGCLRVRCRIDGVMQVLKDLPKLLQGAIVSRLKIMADISIAEKRMPQDGRIQMVLDGRSLDLRVSTLPTVHGESVVMRILDKESLKAGLGDLGLLDDDRRIFDRLLALPDGIVLVTGPTGSGKTTTLYSCLHHLNRTDRKIITVEDPVEYQLSGINQVPVRTDIGMTFASALRAMLRQAPNIVMVGEIRDEESAEVALNAALTGHLVFSTLHTNDAPGAVTRLLDIGVKPFLVASALRAVVAQRLVRKVCPRCCRPHQPGARELRALNLDPARTATATFMKGEGCPHCHGTGYRGRMGVFEVFLITDEIQSLIHNHAGAAILREKARAAGMRTLREDAIRKVTAGLTTIEEVVSITGGDPNQL